MIYSHGSHLYIKSHWNTPSKLIDLPTAQGRITSIACQESPLRTTSYILLDLSNSSFYVPGRNLGLSTLFLVSSVNNTRSNNLRQSICLIQLIPMPPIFHTIRPPWLTLKPHFFTCLDQITNHPNRMIKMSLEIRKQNWSVYKDLEAHWMNINWWCRKSRRQCRQQNQGMSKFKFLIKEEEKLNIFLKCCARQSEV